MRHLFLLEAAIMKKNQNRKRERERESQIEKVTLTISNFTIQSTHCMCRFSNLIALLLAYSVCNYEFGLIERVCA